MTIESMCIEGIRKYFIVAAIGLMTLVSTTADSATIIVDFPSDTNTFGCTLREALVNANFDSNGGNNGCIPGSGADVIEFSFTDETIVLNGNPLVIMSDVTIDGDTDDDGLPDITLDGDQASRVLLVDSGADVTLEGLIITRGQSPVTIDDGGGVSITDGASVAINNSVISDNTADDGGGVYIRNASLEIARTTITENLATRETGVSANGGGIAALSSTLSIADSTISFNAARAPNASLTARGAGVYAVTSILNLDNVTISGNSTAAIGGGPTTGAGAGIFISGVQPALIRNSTIVDNEISGIGDGFRATLDTTLENTIVANTLGASVDDCAGLVNAGVDSIIEDDDCGSSATQGDPDLGPLSNNGGFTLTHLPNPGSIAIDGGNNATCLGADQRGLSRPIDGNSSGVAVCDIGAVEGLSRADLVVDKSSGGTSSPLGSTVTYTLLIGNLGPSDVAMAEVIDMPPARLENVQWTCSAIFPAQCGSGSGFNAINEVVNLPDGTSVEFILSGTVAASPPDESPISNTVTASILDTNVIESDPANNTDSDTDTTGLFSDGFEFEEFD